MRISSTLPDNCKLFLKVGLTIYIRPAVQNAHCSVSLPTYGSIGLSNFYQHKWCKVVFYYGFKLDFPLSNEGEHLHVSMGQLDFLFSEGPIQVLFTFSVDCLSLFYCSIKVILHFGFESFEKKLCYKIMHIEDLLITVFFILYLNTNK